METLWDTKMTITLTLGTWMVPLAITLLSIICVFLVSYFDPDDWGVLAFITFVGGLVATIISWVVWLIMTIMAK
jgi:uncharacterized membrane protein